MSKESTAIVRASEAMVDALIDWKECHDLQFLRADELERIEATIELCNHFRGSFDDDED